MTHTPQTFGLTISTGNVQGEAIHYQMTDTGTFALAIEPLAAMTTAELEAVTAAHTAEMDARTLYLRKEVLS